jgi:hypothetical protein
MANTYRFFDLDQRAQDFLESHIRAGEGISALSRALEEASQDALTEASLESAAEIVWAMGEGLDEVLPRVLRQSLRNAPDGSMEIRFNVDLTVTGLFPLEIAATMGFGFRRNSMNMSATLPYRRFTLTEFLSKDVMQTLQGHALRRVVTGERLAELKLHSGLIEISNPKMQLRTVRFAAA